MERDDVMPWKDKMECSCGHLGDCDPKYMDDLVGKVQIFRPARIAESAMRTRQPLAGN